MARLPPGPRQSGPSPCDRSADPPAQALLASRPELLPRMVYVFSRLIVRAGLHAHASRMSAQHHPVQFKMGGQILYGGSLLFLIPASWLSQSYTAL